MLQYNIYTCKNVNDYVILTNVLQQTNSSACCKCSRMIMTVMTNTWVGEMIIKQLLRGNGSRFSADGSYGECKEMLFYRSIIYLQSSKRIFMFMFHFYISLNQGTRNDFSSVQKATFKACSHMGVMFTWANIPTKFHWLTDLNPHTNGRAHC